MSSTPMATGSGYDDAAWTQLLIGKSAAMGIRLTPLQIEQFATYASELIKWSHRINITAIVEPEEIVVKHFMDSLSASSWLKSGNRVLDIGTGAGFPGLPLKIHQPTLAMTVIDGSRKKINFVSHLIRNLALKDISATQIRSELLRADGRHRQAYDVVVSRALSALTPFVRQALEFVKPDGRILAWKAARAETEIAELKRAAGSFKVLGGRNLTIRQQAYELPGFEEKRSLVIVEFQTPNSK